LKLLLILLAFTVAFVFAQIATNKVKSKRGDINLMESEIGGGKIVCTASFNDTMTVLKQGSNYTLVKASCGQGWVNKKK
jgi:hydrogenase maturation factor HypE